MPRYVVLLRGVNVGASSRVAMPAFRALLERLSCSAVQTYLQSGNAVVTWPGSSADLAATVEAGLREQLEVDVPVLVRSGAELDAVVDGNPFEVVDPKLLHVVFLGGSAPDLDVESLLPDRVAPGPDALYVSYAHDAHTSKAAKLVSSRRFPVVATSRNWRTVLALQELVRA